MIKSPTAFPFAGSYALQIIAGSPDLVRILEWTDDGSEALVAYPLRIGASGNTRVRLADLVNATPLNANERIELAKLETGLAGKKRPRKFDLAREYELRTRDMQSLTMQKLIDQGVRRRLIDERAARLAMGMAA